MNLYISAILTLLFARLLKPFARLNASTIFMINVLYDSVGDPGFKLHDYIIPVCVDGVDEIFKCCSFVLITSAVRLLKNSSAFQW